MIFLDFDGILFKTDYEPLLSSLAASKINCLSRDSLAAIKAAYLLAKPAIRNVADLYAFINSNCHGLATKQSLIEFTSSIKSVRRSAAENGSVYQSFEPTPFFHLLLKWWIEARPMLSILTSRDAATASAILRHYGLFDSIPIYSSMELELSKGMILRQYQASPYAVVDDMIDNLIDIHRQACIEGSLLIFGNWGYGRIAHNKNVSVCECSGEEAIRSLKAWNQYRIV